jgi:hypothetical protein
MSTQSIPSSLLYAPAKRKNTTFLVATTGLFELIYDLVIISDQPIFLEDIKAHADEYFEGMKKSGHKVTNKVKADAWEIAFRAVECVFR